MRFLMKFTIIKVMISIEKINYYKPHWHDEMLEFAMVLSGSIDATIGCDNYRMKEGNILLIGTEDVHSFRKTEDENLLLFIRFDCRLLEKDFPGIAKWNLICDPSVEKSSGTDFDRLRFLMADTVMAKAHGLKDNSKEQSLLKFCRDTFLSTNLLLRKQDVTPAQMETFQKLALYIERNYINPVTLSDVAEYINYSFNHTSVIIKQITGMNFTDYLAHIRCLAAERLLVSTEKTILDIALECGFSDARALGKYFKNWYGVTPGEFREQIERDFTETGLSSFTETEFNNHEIMLKLDAHLKSETRTIILDMKNLPAGELFKPPVLGQPLKHYNSDGSDAVPRLLAGILDGRIKYLKQTDDQGPAVFHGDCGLSANSGIKKAVFYAWDFLSRFKSLIIKEEGIAAGIYEEGIRIILFPPPGTGAEKKFGIIKFIFNSVSDDYIISRYNIDRVHGSSYHLWKELDSPPSLTEELENQIVRHSLPELDFTVIKNRGSFEIIENLPDEGAVMIEIRRQKI